MDLMTVYYIVYYDGKGSIIHSGSKPFNQNKPFNSLFFSVGCRSYQVDIIHL